MHNKIVKRDILHSVSTALLYLLFSSPEKFWCFKFFISKLVLT